MEKSINKDIELAFEIKEDKKNEQCMFELATATQNKIKSYKKQIEDADEITALKLAIKFRKAQQEYEENEERAKLIPIISFPPMIEDSFKNYAKH